MAKELLVKILLAQSTLYMFWIIETLYRLVYNFFFLRMTLVVLLIVLMTNKNW